MSLLERIRREYIQVTTILRTLRRAGSITPESPTTMADIIEHWAAETPDSIALYFENRRYTYRDFDRAGNQYARWAQGQGIQRGDVVALLMENRPEFLFAHLGLAKIGAVGALINSHLRGEALAHSLTVAGARHLILGAELGDAWQGAVPYVAQPPVAWSTGGVVAGTQDLDVELSCRSPEPVGAEIRAGMTAAARCLLVYTSGTTGLPKAANISHVRYLSVAYSFSALSNVRAKDRMYMVLPLYHSSGLIAGAGAAFTAGAAVVLRRRFSTQFFWDDCVRYQATLFQYIGELCRYLLNAPPDPQERAHKIRCVIGNGLRPEIWRRFQERFGIPRIIEFYGATEGNVSMVNADGTPGAIGRIPSYLENLFRIKLIKFDVEKLEPVRGPDGLCLEAAVGEAGEAIGQIRESQKRGIGRFEGYTDKKATESKILRDVFEPGDAWFRTGDLMRKDENGYFYFIDRIGDTFRWKGENVATSEVAQVLATFPGVQEANVYGVTVPGTEGRAGMAALVVEPTIDLNGLHQHLERCLPPYARPLFLRLQSAIDATGTFKQRKVDLVAAGFSPEQIGDPLYFDHPKLRGFVPLDHHLHGEIVSGVLKL